MPGEMTHVSLFTGIGGIDLAAELAGFTTVAQVERDSYCLRVLARHWPGVYRCDDISKFPDRDFGAIDLVSGGPPCQPSSVTGKRRGRADDRWLWPEMLRVIRTILPRWVVAENPPGILALENGVAIEAVLSEMENAGYEILPPIIYPLAGMGAPHFRQRTFFVAHLDRNGRETSRPAKPSRRKTQDSMLELSIFGWDWWATEPGVVRVVHGIPNRVDRIRALGNAVSPQQILPILRAIITAEKVAQ